MEVVVRQTLSRLIALIPQKLGALASRLLPSAQDMPTLHMNAALNEDMASRVPFNLPVSSPLASFIQSRPWASTLVPLLRMRCVDM